MTEEAPPQEKQESSFGDELRKEREIRGISLAEIADATKISKRFLDAIERNDYSVLPAPVFTRGFVREYARYLGLNPEEMVDRYAVFARAHQAPADAQPLPLVSSAFPERVERPATINRALMIAAAIVLPMLLIALLLLWRIGASAGRDQSEPAVAAPVRSESAAAAPSSATSFAPSPLSLVLETTDRVWLVVEVDGKTAITDELAAGERRTLTADERIDLKEVGNAGGLKLTLNGVVLPPLGATGEVVKNTVLDRSVVAEVTAGRPPFQGSR